jgi:hypothetical protein
VIGSAGQPESLRQVAAAATALNVLLAELQPLLKPAAEWLTVDEVADEPVAHFVQRRARHQRASCRADNSTPQQDRLGWRRLPRVPTPTPG